MSVIKYSILNYSPSLISFDTISVGILFYIPEIDKRIFHFIKKMTRLHSIDSELDLSDTRNYLKSVQKDVQLAKYNDFNITEYTRFFVNEYHFSKVNSVIVDDIEEFIELTIKAYLPQEFEVKDRLNQLEQIKYLKTYGKSQYDNFTTKNIIGVYNENLNIDFSVGNYTIKFFDLNNKNYAHMYNAAKAWAFNSLKESSTKELVFIYSCDNDQDDIDAKNIIKILKENKLTFDFKEGIQFLSNPALVNNQ